MEVKTFEEFERIKKLPVFKGVIVSASMEPLIRVGDKIVVNVGETDLKRFDIIVFWQNDQIMCHYVWAMNRMVKPFLIQTRALRYGGRDAPIGMDVYLGKVVSHHLSGWNKFRIFLSQFAMGNLFR